MFNMFKKNQKETMHQSKQKQNSKSNSNQIYYQDQAAELPENFAQHVMDLEMQLEFIQTFNMDVVQQLNEMYRIGIQYYVNEDPRKANHFQKKLASLLTNPQTLDLIEQKTIPAKSVGIDHSSYTSHLKIELNKFNTQSDVVVRSMIEGSNKKVQKSNRLMSDHLYSQEDKLKRRLEERSKSKKKTLTEQ